MSDLERQLERIEKHALELQHAVMSYFMQRGIKPEDGLAVMALLTASLAYSQRHLAQGKGMKQNHAEETVRQHAVTIVQLLTAESD